MIDTNQMLTLADARSLGQKIAENDLWELLPLDQKWLDSVEQPQPA